MTTARPLDIVRSVARAFASPPRRRPSALLRASLSAAVFLMTASLAIVILYRVTSNTITTFITDFEQQRRQAVIAALVNSGTAVKGTRRKTG